MFSFPFTLGYKPSTAIHAQKSACVRTWYELKNLLHEKKMDRDNTASTTSGPSENDNHKRSARRTVTFHLPPRLVTKHDATSRFQEIVKHRKEQKSTREEHRRKVREARILADEALERVSPSALMTESQSQPGKEDDPARKEALTFDEKSKS